MHYCSKILLFMINAVVFEVGKLHTIREHFLSTRGCPPPGWKATIRKKFL
jgi:hypothetical protein